MGFGRDPYSTPSGRGIALPPSPSVRYLRRRMRSPPSSSYELAWPVGLAQRGTLKPSQKRPHVLNASIRLGGTTPKKKLI